MPLPTQVIVLDVETTGLDPRRARIIEVAAVRVVDEAIEDRFTRLLHHSGRIPKKITALTGIDNAMLRDAPPADQVLSELYAFVGKDCLMAHHARFDQRFLEFECRRAGLSVPANPFLCTLALARKRLPGLPSYALHNLAAFLNIPDPPPHHRALPDALLTARLWLELKKIRAQ